MNGIKDKIEDVVDRGERKMDDVIMDLAAKDNTLLGVVVGAVITVVVMILLIKVF